MPPEASFGEWLRRARGSFALAQAVGDGVYFEDLCFQAQQAAEKAVKALLIFNGRDFPYTHDLARLITVLMEANIPVPERVQEAPMLSEYASFTRYPGAAKPVTAEEHEDAMRVAEVVLAWVAAMIEAGGSISE